MQFDMTIAVKRFEIFECVGTAAMLQFVDMVRFQLAGRVATAATPTVSVEAIPPRPIPARPLDRLMEFAFAQSGVNSIVPAGQRPNKTDNPTDQCLSDK